MNTLNASLASGGSPASRFESALALSIAESGNEFVETRAYRLGRSFHRNLLSRGGGLFGPNGMSI